MLPARSLTLLLVLFGSHPSFAEPLPLRGRILDSGGRPPAEARVTLHPIEPSFVEGKRWLMGETRRPTVAEASPDDQGFFELTAPEAGMWTAVAAAPGRVPMEFPLIPLVEPRQLPDVTLPRDERLALRVVSPQGAPVAGARVEAWASKLSTNEPSADEPTTWQPAQRRVVTDARGEAWLPRLSGELVRLAVLAAGFPPAESETREPRTTIALRPGRSQEIVLRAGVRALGGAVARLGEAGWPVGLSDAEGRVELFLPPTRRAPILVELADRYRPASPLPTVTPGEASMELSMPLPTSRRSRVVDAVDGRPVAGAVIWPSGRPDLFVRSDEAGTYLLEGLHVSDRWLRTAAAGYFREFFEHGGNGRANGKPPVHALVPAASLAGKIVDGNGRALAGVEVRASWVYGYRRSGIRENDGREGFARSAPDGTFHLAGLLPRASYDLEIRHEGFAPARHSAGALSRGPNSLPPVALRRGYTAHGMILDDRDSPLPNAFARLEIPSLEAPFEAISDAEGRFEISHLPAANADLEVTRQGFAPARVNGLRIGLFEGGEELPDGARVDLGTLVLAPGVGLEGLVLDPAENPLRGAEIRFSREPSPPWQARPPDEWPPAAATSAGDGSFRLKSLRPGETLTLSVRLAGYAPVTRGGVLIDESREPLTVVLEPMARVAGRVVEESGEPLVRAGVALVPQGLGPSGNGAGEHRVAETLSAGDGRFELEAPPGKLTLVISALGYQRAVLHDLEAAPGTALQDLIVTLKRGAELTGQVRRADGSPARGALVRLFERAADGRLEPTWYGARTDGEGRYRLGGVPPGRQLLGAELDGYPRTVREVDLEPAENVVDLELAAGSAVGGRTLDLAGQPVGGAELALTTTGPRPSPVARTRSRSDGSFFFEGIPPQVYILVASREGYAPTTSEPISVDGGGVENVELELSSGTVLTGQIHGLEPADYPTVEIRAMTWRALRRGSVAYDGTYQVEDLGPGEWVVQARLADGRQAQNEIVIDADVPEVSANLEFGRGFALTGRATRAGEPLAGARVSLAGIDVLRSGLTATRGDGTFRIDGLAPGRYRLTLEDALKNLFHREELILEEDEHLELDLGTARLEGRVIDARDRTPLGGVRLLARSAKAEEGLPHRAQSDSQGFFRFGELAGGAWRVLAEKAGFETAELAVTVGPETAQEDLEIELESASRLSLRVVSASSVPPAEVHVAALDPSGQWAAGGTFPVGPGGDVEIAALGEGRWQLFVGGDGRATETLWVDVPSAPTTADLRVGGAVEIEIPELAGSNVIARARLVDEAGRELVQVERGGQIRREWRVVLGRVAVEWIPAGTWQARITTSDERSWQATVEVLEGERKLLVF